LTVAFCDAKQIAIEMFGTVAVGSYQGLMAALRRYSAELLKLVWALLHRRMERVAGEHWRIGIWLALAVDGSRVSTPGAFPVCRSHLETLAVEIDLVRRRSNRP
jgi:hypothetical protein